MLTILCWQASTRPPSPWTRKFALAGWEPPRSDDLRPLEYPLRPANTHVYLRGRIDRSTNSYQNNKDYLTVVDYKSGNRTLT